MENYSFGKLTRKVDNSRTNNSRMSDAEVYNARTNNARMSDAEVYNARTNNARMSDAEVCNARTNNVKMSDAEVYNSRTNNSRISNSNVDSKTTCRENLTHPQCEQKRMSVGDRIFLQSVIKRQKLVIQDLCHLNEFYPNMIDKDVIGGLFSLFCLLDDGAQSSEFSDRH